MVYRSRFLSKEGGTYATLFVSDIAYLVEEQEGVVAVMVSGKRWPLSETINEAAESLNPREFFRLNDQCLARPSSIVSVRRRWTGGAKVDLMPSPGRTIPLDRETLYSFRQWIEQDRGPA